MSSLAQVPVSPEGFVRSVAPGADFMAISVQNGSEDGGRGAAVALAEASGLSFFDLSVGLFVVATMFGGPGDALLSGVISLPGGGEAGPSILKEGAVQPGHTRGSFTALEWSGDVVVAHQDEFGMGTLYVCESDTFAFVTNRLHLATMAAHLLSGEVQMNRARVLSAALDHMLFSAQNFTNDTFLEGVVRVPIGCRVVLGTAGLSLETQPMSLSDAGHLDYTESLREAWEEVCGNVRVYKEAFPESDFVVDVSGGRDSRVVLAAALAVLGPEGFTIHTADVADSDDLAVSLYIAERYGLHYAPARAPRTVLGDGQALASWRSYMMGEYNVLGIGSTSSSGRSRRVRLSGGAGEVHRDFWAKILLGGEVESGASIGEVAIGLASRHDAVSKKLSTVDQESLLEYVGEQFRGDRQPIVEALDTHYLHFRNRAHFGQRRFSTLHDCYYAFPLLSSALYAASHSVAWASRAQGDVFDDLLRLYAPDLAVIPYDGSREARALPSGAEIRRNWMNAQVSEPGAVVVGGAPARSVDEELELAVAEACARLSHACSSLAEVTTALADAYLQRVRAWPKSARQLASAILALDDAAYPMATLKTTSAGSDAEVWRYINPISSLVSYREGSRLCVSVKASRLVDPGDYEFAFYHYVGMTRAATVWYSKKNVAVFDANAGDGRIVAFARRAGSEAIWSLSQKYG